MKMRLTLLITSFVIFVGLIIFFVYKTINNDNSCVFKPIYNVKYVGDDGLACLTFYKNGKYSMYDCESEPTNYFFDSENECKYKFEKEYIKFKCKYNYSNIKNKSILIENWTEDEFKFVYNGIEKVFYAKK